MILQSIPRVLFDQKIQDLKEERDDHGSTAEGLKTALHQQEANIS